MKIQQIADKLYLVEGKNRGRYPFAFSLLIRDRVTALIDTGCGQEVLTEIETAYSPEMVIHTHAHPDHCAGAHKFSSRRLWGPIEGRESTGKLQSMAARFVVPELRSAWISYMHDVLRFKDFQTDNHFADGHHFDFGSTQMEALHLPGHTADHYGFYFPREKALFATDIDLTGFGPWYGNPESDKNQFIRSIERIQGYEVDSFISSHLGLIRDRIGNRLDRYGRAIGERDQKILAFLDAPRSMDDFVEAALIYQSYPYMAPVLRWFEANMIEQHLRDLMERGLVTAEDGRFLRRSPGR
jgi:glyoxylase-like metal-dependent hydrolase (beta-lactamase superfamily II)